MRFNFFKRETKAKDWDKLSTSQLKLVAKKMIRAIKNLSGAKYTCVQGDNIYQREQPLIETKNEDGILTLDRRNRLLDLVRNAVRNSSTFAALLRQVDLNCVGNEGGKIIFNYDDIEAIRDIRYKFYDYTRETDFFDNLPLNTLLKIILKTYLIGGDMVLIYDNGLIEDSGKVVIYEPDEIMNSTDEAIKKHYGSDAWLCQGRVYNRNGRNIGVVVSRSCRGMQTAPEEKCYFLKRNPDESIMSLDWLMPRNVWRAAGGRGVTQASSVIATLTDENDLVGFELQAAKKSSLIFAQITNTRNETEVETPSAFDTETDFSSMTEEQIEEAIKEETNANETTVSLEAARSAGIIYLQMPDNYKMECLSPEHPNVNTIEFVKWLASRSSAAFGLSLQYATLAANGNDYKAERLLTEPFFKETLKFLETICDWIFARWTNWENERGNIDKSKLGEDFMRHISWSWPRSAELDENAYQDAVAKKLNNFTSNYAEILGPEWREKLLESKKEIDWFKANNIPHPAYNMISGGERSGADVLEKEVINTNEAI